jgi:hypothetical protein
MVKIDVDLIIAFLICAELISILISIFKENRKMLFSKSFKAKIIKCEICSHVYFVPYQITFSKCPLCLSINREHDY